MMSIRERRQELGLGLVGVALVLCQGEDGARDGERRMGITSHPVALDRQQLLCCVVSWQAQLTPYNLNQAV